MRNRLSRGTLESVREGGVTYVVLEDVTTDTDDIPPTDAATDYRDELIQVLREQLEAEREANRENRRIIMQQAQSLAAIEAPQPPEEPPESPESVSEGADRGEASESRAEAQSGSQEPVGDTRPWWRRLFNT